MDRLVTEVAGVIYTLEDFQFLFDTIENELNNRTSMIGGYGIVASEDPAVTFTAAFNVTYSDTTGKISVEPGNAFLPNQTFASITAITQIDPPTDTVDYYLILGAVAQYNTPRLVRYNVSVDVRLQYLPVLVLVKAADYATSAYYGSSLILAKVKLESVTRQVIIDLTRSSVSSMRPWFTPIDYYHRSLVGTGTSSITNPHGMSIADLTLSGDITFWDFFNPAMIITNNRIHRHVMGDLYEERVPYTSLPSVLPPITFYLELFPYRVYSVKGASSGKDLKFTYSSRIKQTVIQEALTSGEDLIVSYSVVHSGRPSIDKIIPSRLVLSGMVGDELVVSEADAIANSLIVETTLDFRPLNYFPNNYLVYLKKTGQYVYSPSIVFGPIAAVEINPTTSPADVGYTLSNASILEVGLYSPDLSYGGSTLTWQLDLKLTGKDSAGGSLSETVTFTNLTWQKPADSQIGKLDAQWQDSVESFSELDTVQITNALEVPLNSVITIVYRPVLNKELIITSFKTRPRYHIVDTTLYDLRPADSMPIFKEKVLLDKDALILEYFSDPVFADIDNTSWESDTPFLMDGYYTSRWINRAAAVNLDIYFQEFDSANTTVELYAPDISGTGWTTLSQTRLTSTMARYLISGTGSDWIKLRITTNTLSRLIGFVLIQP